MPIPQINQHFATYVYSVILNHNLNIIDDFKTEEHWNCQTQTSNYQPHLVYPELTKDIEYHVNAMATNMGSNYHYKPTGSWVNKANKGDYQEYHNHPENTFSAIYYHKINSGNLVIRDRFHMKPLKNIIDNDFNYETYTYRPVRNELIIFRSHLLHMVTPCNEERITIAMNFD